MDDRNKEVLEQYALEIYHIYRARGAFVLETDQGLKLMRSCTGSEARLEFEKRLTEHLQQNGCNAIDVLIRNKEGLLSCANNYGERFMIKDWFAGEECSLRKPLHVCMAAGNLAGIHIRMKGLELTGSNIGERYIQDRVEDVFSRRTRELKRVKSYLREKKQKNSFEVVYLNVCEEFYEQAHRTMELLKELDLEKIYQEAGKTGSLCHGSYTHHNLLMISDTELADSGMVDGIPGNCLATVNFDKAIYGLQIMDVYHFLRKTMEKNGWDISLAAAILEEYGRYKKIGEEEGRLLYILLSYPEKFWKITNYYYNNKKSWISQKNLQKLLAVKEQSEMKQVFLSGLERLNF